MFKPDKHGMNDWCQTYGGRQFWPLAPRAEDVDIRDLAHHLALINRFGGATDQPYSVAQHSVHVADQFDEPVVALCALLHDGGEGYLGFDPMRPIKHALSGVAAAERRIARQIALRFDLPFNPASPHPWPAAVHAVDDRILLDECRDRMARPPAGWAITGEPLGIDIPVWDWRRAEAEFLAAFERLDIARRAGA